VRALANLAVLERKGALGPYGFRDALDYTRPEPRSQRYAVVGNYMAHHVGMSLVALTNVLCGRVWQERFHADPLVRSAELLLHERIPRRLVLQGPQVARADEALPDPDLESPVVREFDSPDTQRPHVALLGRQPYTVMVSHCGRGLQPVRGPGGHALARGRHADATGQFCYVKDVTTRADLVRGAPAGVRARRLVPGAARHRPRDLPRTDGDIETRTEIAVVPGGRRGGAARHGHQQRRRAARDRADQLRRDRAGPAGRRPRAPGVRNLFVETEWHEWCTAITATRRPRPPRAAALVRARRRPPGERVGPVSCETDRARFLGRGAPRAPARSPRTARSPGTTGAVLDPIFALRTRVRLEPAVGVGGVHHPGRHQPRERAFELADRYHDPHAAQRALDLAWTSQQVELRELRGLTPADAAVFQELAGFLLYPRPELRAPQEELLRNRGSQPLLWATASRATGRSCSRPSIRRTGCRRCGSSSPPTTTGAAAG
jgi:cyclic beta-1,2-glucan synthetase